MAASRPASQALYRKLDWISHWRGSSQSVWQASQPARNVLDPASVAFHCQPAARGTWRENGGLPLLIFVDLLIFSMFLNLLNY